MNCDCPHGTCKEFGFTGRRADICAGRVLTPEKCEAYRKNWRRERKMPALTTRVVNYATEHAKWIAAGCPVRAKDDQAAALEKCAACEYKTAEDACRMCGCRLKAKVRLATAHCPLGIW